MNKKIKKCILILGLLISGYLQPIAAQTEEEQVVLEVAKEEVEVIQEAFNDVQTRSMAVLEAGKVLDYGLGTYIYDYEMNSVTIEYEGEVHHDILTELFLNGERVYCIEPEVLTTPGEGYQPGEINGVLSDEEKRQLGLISYYGYGYQDDYSDEMSAATMIAVWLARGRVVYDVADEVMEKVAQIQKRVENVDIHPSFEGQSLVFKGYGKQYAITLTDQNHVLEDFHIYDDGGYTIEKSGDTLSIWLDENKRTSGNIVLDRIKRETQGASIVYVNADDCQKLMKIYPQNSEGMEMKPSLAKGTLRIRKQNEDGVIVPNTTFALSYHESMQDIIGTYTTDETGYVTIPELEPRAVYVQEQAVPLPYVIDSSISKVELVGNETISFTKENRYKKGHLRILKKDRSSGKEIAIEGVEFGIYNEQHQYLHSVFTDESGTAVSGDLRYGKYYFKEIKAPYGYLLNPDEVAFEINEDGVEIVEELQDTRVKAEIKIEKQDQYTEDEAQGDAELDGAVYGLYAEEDITSPDDHRILYHKDELVMQKTIAQHVASFEDLLLGKYYVKEIQPSLGYTLDESKYPIDCRYENDQVALIQKQQIVKERVKSQSFQIIKISTDGEKGEVPLLQGAQFTIKLKRDVEAYGWDKAKIANNAQGITTPILITDEKGFAQSEELPYGDYIIRETKTPEGCFAVQDFEVHISEDLREPQVWRIFNDAPINVHIKVVKVDTETGKTIPSPFIKFKIKNLDTKEYVKFWVKYPNPHLINTFETTDNGSFTTPEGLPCGHYQIEEIEAPYGYVLDDTPLTFEINSDTAYETMEDEESVQIILKKRDPQVKGKISIEKQGDLLQMFDERSTEFGIVYEPVFQRGYLDGATFDIFAAEDIRTPEGTLWYHKDEYVETLTTTKEGPIESSLLPLGSYYVKETASKEGYLIDEQRYDVTLTYQDQITPIVSEILTVWNEKEKGLFTFTKQFEQSYFQSEDSAIKQTKFGMYTKTPLQIDGNVYVEADALLGILTLDELCKGAFQFDFAGAYYLKELQSDPKYLLDETMYDIVFDYQKKSHEVTFQEKDTTLHNYLKKGTLQLNKTGHEGIGLAGVVFELARDHDFKDIVDTQTTDTEGILNFHDLEYGTYYVREKETGELYVLDDTIQTIKMDCEKEELSLVNAYRISSIRLKKLDEESHKPLAGVEFTLYDDFGKALQSQLTNEQGIVEFKELTNGIYHVKETKALPDYQLLKELLDIEIKGNDQGRVYEVEVTNTFIVQTGLTDYRFLYTSMMFLSVCVLWWIGKQRIKRLKF